jgi:hypothetical protein
MRNHRHVVEAEDTGGRRADPMEELRRAEVLYDRYIRLTKVTEILPGERTVARASSVQPLGLVIRPNA